MFYSPCTQQLAWLLEILPLRSPGFQRFSACWPLEWTMPCHLSSSRRFCSWRGLCNCLENMGSSDLLASPEWKVSPRMNQNLQVRVSRSFSSFKSVGRCECEHVCVLLTYPQVFRDVLHRPGKFGSQVFDILKIISHGVAEVHQKVQIDGIILCPLELESKLLWFTCRVTKTRDKKEI